jgi:predicted transcriptional regulator
MIPADIRDANFRDIESHLVDNRASVYWALTSSGPITNKALAAQLGWAIENVRPRVSELIDLGLARLVRKDGRDGVYEAVPLDVARAAHEEALAVATTPKSDQIMLL